MSFRKGIPGKTLDLAPHLRGKFCRISFAIAVLMKFLHNLLEFNSRPVFTAHRPAQNIGIGQVETGEMVAYLQHIFLVHHHTEGLLQLLFHHRVKIIDRFPVVKPPDILPHHAAFGHSRTDNRTGGHQGDVVVATKLFE